MRTLKRIGIALGVVILILMVAYAAVAIDIYSAVGKFSTRGARYPEAHISDLIWPTLGYPALVKKGGSMVVEVDPGGSAAAEGNAAVDGWRASIRPARRQLSELSYVLPPIRSWRTPSTRWPRGTIHGKGSSLWHVEFSVPADAVPELYNLTVGWTMDGHQKEDTQEHSVAVVENSDDTFEFITLADIHVHERDMSGWLQPLTDKGISNSGKPVFFERAIEQVNIIRPDFVVILGDCVRAQHKAGEYQVEFENFFRTLSRLEVPVFALPGNHDQYVNEVDGARVWQQNMGPLFYSFDVGACHFTCANTYDWPYQDRVVMQKLGLFTYPRKWQGQVLGAGDERDMSTYSGQLAWLKNDLAAARGAKLRILFCHHDPFLPDGTGRSFNNEVFAGIFPLGGGGAGRDALVNLVATYGVAAVFSGHLHTDFAQVVGWANGNGNTIFATQTCVFFDQGGQWAKYPGYRLVKVDGGRIAGYSYVDSYHSFPFYDGSSLTGKTDLDGLDRPALSALTLPGSATTGFRGWRLVNYLGVPIEVRGLITESSGPVTGPVEGGEVYRTVSVPGKPGAVLLYVDAQIGKGTPGLSATEAGTPSELTIKIPVQSKGTTAGGGVGDFKSRLAVGGP
jgi:3',5'-cyclic AMP phosphodiesterase CpdA